MKLRIISVGIIFLPLALLCQVQPTSLPIKRVVLYKNGIGYFEHLGQIRGDQNVAVSFTSGQLNDVLKSLTVLDLNGGRVTGIAYGSSAPLDRQLGDLKISLGDKSSLTDFLTALRGAKLEVRSGTTVVSGRLLSVERKTRISGGTTLEVDYLSLITDSGELRTTELAPSFSVRLIDRGLAGKVDRFLDLVASSREPDIRRMLISTEGSGERSLFVSYISEVPVWKATYRIVLDSKSGRAPLLQGWAVVDNTVGEDWDNVQLSLVAGAPQSFVQNLGQPYYARRPVIAMPGAISMTPQTHQPAVVVGAARLSGRVTDANGAGIPGARVVAFTASNSLAGEAIANASGTFDLRSLPDGEIRLEVESAGFRKSIVTGVAVTAGVAGRRDIALEVGNVSQTVSVTAEAPGIQTSASVASARSAGSGRALGRGTGLGGGNLAGSASGVVRGSVGAPSSVSEARNRTESAAIGKELGDLFEYKLKDPITIQKNSSALVPIVHAPVSVEKVSIWNEQKGSPERALWFTNSTGNTLDGGSFSVLEEDTFAGEGIFDSINSGEKRLVSYAADLALHPSSKQENEAQRVSRVRISRGIMTHDSEMREKKTYTFRNQDSVSRTVIIEHAVRSGYELRSTVKPVETTSDWMRFRLEVRPRSTASLHIEEARPIQAAYTLTNLKSELVAGLVQQGSIEKSVEAALRRILDAKAVAEGLEEKKTALDEDVSKLFDDQQRLRENLKALKGSAEEKALIQRYTQQLNEQETRLELLRKQIRDLETKQVSANTELDQLIENLSFDVRM